MHIFPLPRGKEFHQHHILLGHPVVEVGVLELQYVYTKAHGAQDEQGDQSRRNVSHVCLGRGATLS